jgi:hypothetical protein
MLGEAMDLTENPESTPTAVERVQYLIAESANELGFMDMTVNQLAGDWFRVMCLGFGFMDMTVNQTVGD